MAEGSAGTKPAKKLVEIDIISDTVCPWCFVGKRNLDKAVEASNGRYDFRIRWHPYQLNLNAPKEGLDKRKYYEQKFGSDMSAKMGNRMSEATCERDIPGFVESQKQLKAKSYRE